jgi:predicted TIM-barrel fold metal-dependent hydrolase
LERGAQPHRKAACQGIARNGQRRPSLPWAVVYIIAGKNTRGWRRFDEIRAGGYDPGARLHEMDEDGVDAEVLYPTPRLAQAIVATPDPELHLEMIRAYNDWISEFVAHAPARFGGLAMLPNRGAASAAAEVERVWGRPGVRGFVMGCYPNGSLEVERDDDRVWAALADADITLSLHVSLGKVALCDSISTGKKEDIQWMISVSQTAQYTILILESLDPSIPRVKWR